MRAPYHGGGDRVSRWLRWERGKERILKEGRGLGGMKKGVERMEVAMEEGFETLE